VQQLTKKEQGFSNQYMCHTWTDSWLILYTEKGEILLVETSGDFKMLLPDSPVHQFSIRYAINSRPNGFIIADNAGRYLVYESFNDPKCPFAKLKSLVSSLLALC
jgi:hypothetical protein